MNHAGGILKGRCLIVLLAIFAFFAWFVSAYAQEDVELTGIIQIRTINCAVVEEDHEHDEHCTHDDPLANIEFLVMDEKTSVQTKLVAPPEVLKELRPFDRVRVRGRGKPTEHPGRGLGPPQTRRTAAQLDALDGGAIEVEEIEIEIEEDPAISARGGDLLQGGSAPALKMLTCLLVFASSNTHPCMTLESNARGRLFDNPTNANLGMQAITKGHFGLRLADVIGGRSPIVDLQLNVDSAGVSSRQFETLMRNAIIGMGYRLADYDRVLMFPPGGGSDANFTAYAYFGTTTSVGMVSVYGNSYGNNRMNGYLHELGHNFGFAHSSKDTSEYGDRTCVMGLSNSGTQTETYNAVKLLQANWLEPYNSSGNPAGVALTQDMTVNLYPLSSDLTVVDGTVALHDPSTGYFVAYHRNDLPYGLLTQTGDRDKVFVYSKSGGPLERSFQVANLSEGDSFENTITVHFGAYGPNNQYVTVSVDVDDGNTMPELTTNIYGTGQNTPVVLSMPVTDADGDSITYATLTNPANGTLSGFYPNVTYTPHPGFLGSDSFRISASDHLISNFITVTVLTFVDTDGDGLDDAWELQYFGNLSQGPNGDPDGDGQTNLTEFYNGTDPTRAPTLLGKLTGTVIGTPGSYLNDPAWDKHKVFDGSISTYYDAANASGDWVGLDLGSPKRIGLIRFAPRSTWPGRMTGGMFQASNSADFSSGVVTFHTISGTPAIGVLTSVPVNNAGAYRYVRYLGPNNGFCNVAEVEFYEDGAPEAPTGLVATGGSGVITLNWNDNTEADLVGYNVYRGTQPGTYGFAPVATGVTQSQYTDSSISSNVTYYYVVSAVDTDGLQGANSNESSASLLVNNFPPVVNAGLNQTVVISSEAPWLPTDVSGAAGWYDASDTATIAASGASVSAWNDKSGNALHLSQPTANRRPTTGTTINGLNVIRFLGHNLETSTNPFAPTIQDALVIAVHRVDAAANGQTLFSLSGSAVNAERWQAHAPWGTLLYFDTGGTGGGNRVSANYGVSAGDTVLASFYGSTTDNVQQVFKNGALLVGDASGHAVGTIGNIFVGSSANTQYQTTSIGEFIIIKGTVSVQDRQKLEGYLAHKWGLQGNLPASHPHKEAAPGGSGAIAELSGTVSDPDGNPLTTTWTMVSGPGAVNFTNVSQTQTTVTFSEPGAYVLRLTANDGLFTTYNEVTVTVTEEGENSPTDSNDNGIDDAWEMEKFGRLLAEEEIIHESGVPFYFLYLHGTDVNDPSDRFRISVEANESNTTVVFAWEVLEQYAVGSHYSVLVSTNLTHWEPISAEHFTIEHIPVAEGRVRVELSIPADYSDRVFLRLSRP